MFLIITIFCGIFCRGVSVTCPPKQFIERMGNKNITCSVDVEVERCVWYLGSTTSTPPILKFGNRIKGGTNLSDKHYDITDYCEMEIIEAQISHEANYTFVAFLTNGTKWRQVVAVQVTVTPAQLCPIIPTCNECDNCIVKSSENEVRKLTCYIDGIRPAVELYWQHEGALTIISNRSHSEPSEAVTATWNSSATLQYTLPCKEDAIIYCRSNGGNISTAVVNIISVCNHPPNPVNISQKTSSNICQKGPHICWIIFGIPAVSIFIAGIGLIIYFFRGRTGKEETADTSVFLYETLMKELKTIYTDHIIPEIEILYTGCQVVRCYANGNSDVSTSEEILEGSFLSQSRHALFIGESGYGKTFYFQHLLNKWIKGDAMQSVLLIYFQLKFLSPESNILREITAMLSETSISVQELNKILKGKESIILLDGENYLEFQQSLTNDTDGDNMDECTVTVNDLLNNNDAKSFPDMKVWVCSRPFEYKKTFEKPFSLVLLDGFTKSQRNQLFSQMIKHYSVSDGNNSSNRELLTGEEVPLLPQCTEKSIELAWDQLYGSIEEGKPVSPLVVYLFALNFLRTDKTLVISNSLTPFKVSWDKNNFTVELSQIDWHLLASLFKSCGQDEWKRMKIKSPFQEYNMIFEKGKEGYNTNAVTELCMTCREFDFELDGLTFWKDYPTVLNKYLPKVKNEVIFKEISLEKGEFINLIKSLPEGITSLRFVDCKMPEKLTNEEFKDVTTKTVHRMNGKKTYYFDFENATWTKRARDEVHV